MLFPNSDVVVNPALVILLGVLVGALGGFFGVGGGFLITGGLLVFGVPTIYAVGTGLALIMGSSIVNVLKHRKAHNVDFRLGWLLLAGTLPAVLLAERLNATLERNGLVGPFISYLYVVVLGLLGGFILWDYLKTRRRNLGLAKGQKEALTTAALSQRIQGWHIPPASIALPGARRIPLYVALPASSIGGMSVWVPLLLGFGVGFLAGLLGAGGGFIMLPILIYVLGVPTTIAVGTGLFQIVFTGTLGTALYALANHVDLLMTVIMLAASSAGAQLGVTATRHVPAARIRFLYALTLLGAGAAVLLQRLAQTYPALAWLAPVSATLLLGMAGAICLVIGAMLVVALRSRAA